MGWVNRPYWLMKDLCRMNVRGDLPINIAIQLIRSQLGLASMT